MMWTSSPRPRRPRAEGELAAQAKRKQQILDQLDQQLQKNKDAWVDTHPDPGVGRGGSNMGNTQASNAILAKGAGDVWPPAHGAELSGASELP